MTVQDIYIPIKYADVLNLSQMKEVCAGIEEEGVPYRLQKEEKGQTSIELAAEAASSSPLHIGIGIDQYKKISVHHEKLKKEEPYLTGDLQSGRQAGKNAARLVKGLSLTL